MGLWQSHLSVPVCPWSVRWRESKTSLARTHAASHPGLPGQESCLEADGQEQPGLPLTLLSGPLRLLLATSLVALLLAEAGSASLPQVCVGSSRDRKSVG